MKRGGFSNAVALLIGTTIGAGIFGIPYVFAKAGFLTGLIDLFILGIVVLFVNLYVGEIALRTKAKHMLAGYVGKYLGKYGKYSMTLISVVGIFGAMISYLIGEGQAFSAIFGGNSIIYSLGFFAAMSVIIWFDLNAVAESDKIFSIAMIILIAVICFIAFKHVDLENLKLLDFNNLLIPYGVVLFALIGASAVPEMEEEIDGKMLKKAIMIGTLIPLFVYLAFSAAVVGVTGLQTTEIASLGLGNALGEYMVLLSNAFVIFAMATSFISLGLAMKWMLRYDYKLSNALSWGLTCFIPLIIFLAGARSFIGVIGLTGAIAGGLEGALIVLTAKAAKGKSERKPEYSIPLNWVFAILIALLFLIGIVYQFYRF